MLFLFSSVLYAAANDISRLQLLLKSINTKIEYTRYQRTIKQDKHIEMDLLHKHTHQKVQDTITTIHNYNSNLFYKLQNGKQCDYTLLLIN